MMSIQTAHAPALSLVAPAATLPPPATSPQAQGSPSVEIAALHARFDPSLDSLRAGTVVTPASFDTNERAELTAAQQRDTSLAALRAGDEPSADTWKWLAIGAGVVLLIILL